MKEVSIQLKKKYPLYSFCLSIGLSVSDKFSTSMSIYGHDPKEGEGRREKEAGRVHVSDHR